MARTVKPELVATIEPVLAPGVASPQMGGPPLPEPTELQLEALQVLVDYLHETKLPKREGYEQNTAAEVLLQDAEEVTVKLRRVAGGEVWVRVE